jgi:hypothetical protein
MAAPSFCTTGTPSSLPCVEACTMLGGVVRSAPGRKASIRPAGEDQQVAVVEDATIRSPPAASIGTTAGPLASSKRSSKL